MRTLVVIIFVVLLVCLALYIMKGRGSGPRF